MRCSALFSHCVFCNVAFSTCCAGVHWLKEKHGHRAEWLRSSGFVPLGGAYSSVPSQGPGIGESWGATLVLSLWMGHDPLHCHGVLAMEEARSSLWLCPFCSSYVIEVMLFRIKWRFMAHMPSLHSKLPSVLASSTSWGLHWRNQERIPVGGGCSLCWLLKLWVKGKGIEKTLASPRYT